MSRPTTARGRHELSAFTLSSPDSLFGGDGVTPSMFGAADLPRRAAAPMPAPTILTEMTEETTVTSPEPETSPEPSPEPVGGLRLTHTHAEGTLLEGTSRGDGAFEVLRRRPGNAYWKWGRSIGMFYIPQSRDRLPNRHRIEKTADALREAGFVVTVEIDADTRNTGTVVTEKRERLAERADALDARAERKTGERDAAFGVVDQISDLIPLGQPILVGHHSEGRHRRDLAKMDNNLRKGVEAGREAREAARSAEIARLSASGRESRTTVANRVETLRAEMAVDLRALWGVPADMRHLPWQQVAKVAQRLTGRGGPVDQDSERGKELIERITDVTDRRRYWAEVLAGMPGVDPGKVSKGDAVQWRGQWYPVVRKNAKSVSVPSIVGGSWTDTLKYDELTGHRPAAG